MISAQYSGDKKIFVGQAISTPPGPGEVQIKVAFVGLCGTDLHILHGAMDARVKIPLIFGHEMSGEIAMLGPQVQEWQVGDKVTVMPLDWDNTCPACLAGNKHICQNLNFVGIDSPGALQGLWNVNSSWLLALPADISLKDAALIEPVAVAVHDVRRAELKSGEKIIILGGGPIGILIATVAREFGAEILLAEIDQNRRRMVEEIGFKTIDPTDEGFLETINEWTNGAGADAVFEVSGAASAVLQATDIAKVRGRIVIVAIHPTPRNVNLHRIFMRELTIVGVRVYERIDFELAIEYVSLGKIPCSQLISKVVPISEISDAVATLEAGQAMKILIDVGGAAK
jgi:(R,R)-butanediol dehydrogenase / meso-butanediol dehydrogenase / diacetyl reductase